MPALCLSAVLAALVLAGPAGRRRTALKGHDTNAPVDVAADRIEVQDRADRAMFTGNVVVQQADLTLDRGAADGGLFQRTAAARYRTARCARRRHRDQRRAKRRRGDFAVYDLDRRLITMVGGVTLDAGRQTRCAADG